MSPAEGEFKREERACEGGVDENGFGGSVADGSPDEVEASRDIRRHFRSERDRVGEALECSVAVKPLDRGPEGIERE